MSVWVYKYSDRGETKWRVDYVELGKRKRRRFNSETEARGFANDIERGTNSAKYEWSKLPESERARIILAYTEAKSKGHDLGDLLIAASQTQKTEPKKLGPVILELIESKKKGGRADSYTASLKIVLNQFAKGRESWNINLITFRDVEAFLHTKHIAYHSTLRSRLSTLFKFAIRRGYRLDNPCDRLEHSRYHKPPPKVFTVDEFKTAVAWLKANAPRGLTWFALSTLCGLRPEEADKTTAADISFKEGWVKVERQTTKVRQRRVVYPKPEAMRFLKWSLENGGTIPIARQQRTRVLSGQRKWKLKEGGRGRYKTDGNSENGLRGALGWTAWPKDITRHTAASYWLAGDGSTAHVADMLGNSEKVLRRDYKALVTRDEAEKFWKAVATICDT